DLPVVNALTVLAFNAAYYAAQKLAGRSRLQHWDPFFFPLDGIGHWNRLYGRRGFLQFQCVVPTREALGELLQSAPASPLTVLKRFGAAASPGMLSFPRPGLTLALEVPNRGEETFAQLARREAVVLDVRGPRSAEAGGGGGRSADARRHGGDAGARPERRRRGPGRAGGRPRCGAARAGDARRPEPPRPRSRSCRADPAHEPGLSAAAADAARAGVAGRSLHRRALLGGRRSRAREGGGVRGFEGRTRFVPLRAPAAAAGVGSTGPRIEARLRGHADDGRAAEDGPVRQSGADR